MLPGLEPRDLDVGAWHRRHHPPRRPPLRRASLAAQAPPHGRRHQHSFRVCRPRLRPRAPGGRRPRDRVTPRRHDRPLRRVGPVERGARASGEAAGGKGGALRARGAVDLLDPQRQRPAPRALQRTRHRRARPTRLRRAPLRPSRAGRSVCPRAMLAAARDRAGAGVGLATAAVRVEETGLELLPPLEGLVSPLDVALRPRHPPAPRLAQPASAGARRGLLARARSSRLVGGRGVPRRG
jgi:hypothetical protein